jgi:hypothetical protein
MYNPNRITHSHHNFFFFGGIGKERDGQTDRRGKERQDMPLWSFTIA